MELPSESGAVAAVNDGKAAIDHPGVPACSTIDATGADASKNKYPAILDGTFFRVVSVGDDGNSVKAACVTCPAGKRPLSGTISTTTNFLLHIKVCTFLSHLRK
jgi:hypothetical protein